MKRSVYLAISNMNVFDTGARISHYPSKIGPALPSLFEDSTSEEKNNYHTYSFEVYHVFKLQ